MGRMYQKLALCGGEGGREWDDDVYEGVKKVYVGQDLSRITYVKFEYVKEGGEVVTREYGTITQDPRELVLDFPNEYIKSVEVTYDKPKLFQNTVITSLTFQTSSGRSSFFGYKVGKKFVLEQKDRRLVGFHGKEGDAIDALGAYFAPIQAPTPLIPTKKLPLVGGSGGVKWDDGVFDGVRKIYIGQCYEVVSYVKFDYVKGTELVSGDEHGQTLPEASELVLEDDEYLLSLGGYYDKSRGAIRYIDAIKTNKRDSGESRLNYGEKFTLGENGHKIVGFYGQASDVLHSIGVTVVPITPTE